MLVGPAPHPGLLQRVTLSVFCEGCELWNLLCNFIHPFVTFPFTGAHCQQQFLHLDTAILY